MDALETFASGATTSQSIGWSTLPRRRFLARAEAGGRRHCAKQCDEAAISKDAA